MPLFTLDPRDRTPIYAQLEQGIRAAIATGRLGAGAQLPTVRQLAVELRINANTVARVYGDLERSGVLETRRGVGSFVSSTPAQAQPKRDKDRRLSTFVTRVLADAAAAGFTARELLDALANRAKGGVAMPRMAFRPNVLSSASPSPFAVAGALVWRATEMVVPSGLVVGLGLLIAQSPRVAQQWERAVVLRLGRFVGLRGPGLFWVVPLIDQVSSWIDQRTVTTELRRRTDADQRHRAGERGRGAVLDGARRRKGRAGGPGLRPGGELGGADGAARHHRPHHAHRTAAGTRADRGRPAAPDRLSSNPWGVTVSSVEMRDVVIPGALQDAMSREAQAAREKQARIILGQAEMEIAHSFHEAAKMYQDNPTALHLRAMNMLYEGLKEKGAMMIVPSSAVESMGMGGLLGAAALRQQSLVTGDSPVRPIAEPKA